MKCRDIVLMVALISLVGCNSGPATNGNIAIPKAPALTETETSAEGTDTYRVEFQTTAGDFVVEVHPDWAPRGAERFRELVQADFLADCRFFRVIKDFMVQFGIHGDPTVSTVWKEKTIMDDPVKKSNKRGYVTFATSGPDSRTSQIFINYKDNRQLDDNGFSPIGQVISGMDVVDNLNDNYGGTPSDFQPQIQDQGNAFLDAKFPGLDFIKTAKIIEP